MRRLILLALSLCSVCLMRAQGPLDAVADKLASGEVSFKYRFEVKGDVPLKGDGTAALRGDSFHLFGNGLEIWSDGVTRWTIDRESREAYIETVDSGSVDYMANPATLLGSLKAAFKVESVSDVTLGGRKLQAVNLVPSVDDTGLRTVVLYLDGTTPARVLITVEDGTKTLFYLSDFSVNKKSDATFAFDIATLGPEFVVTDLR